MVDDKFNTSINPKDGHAVSDCIDPREKRVLEFIDLILYLENPGRITKEIINTIFGALAGEYKVNWGQLIQEVVGHLVSNLEKGKATPISPYLFHLYHKNECMRGDELYEIEVAKEILEYGVGPDTPADEEEAGLEGGLVGSKEKRRLLSPNSWLKYTYHSPKGKLPIRNPDWKDMSTLDLEDDPF